MTQNTVRPRGGWQQDEIDILFSAVKEAAETGKPLRGVFQDVGQQLCRKPNSIRNYYYARVHECPQLSARQTPFRAFTPQEVHQLLRSVLIGRGQGESVRACVNRLAGGERAAMLRYQNKYRSILKNRPQMLLEVANELRAEGLPCPEDVTACRHYGKAAPSPAPLDEHWQDPAVRSLMDGLMNLLSRLPSGESEPAVPYQKWAEARREADRLRVEVDLLKMELEDRAAVTED